MSARSKADRGEKGWELRDDIEPRELIPLHIDRYDRSPRIRPRQKEPDSRHLGAFPDQKNQKGGSRVGLATDYVNPCF